MHSRNSSYYKYMRKSKVAHLPSPTTLRAYTGKSTGEVGLTTLVEQRLRMEASRLSPLEKIGSLQVDETTIKQKKKYVRNLGRFVGRVDMGGIPRSPHDKNRLANKVLAFVLSGLSTHYTIPVAIFLVNQLTAEQQTKLTVHVIERVEVSRFKVFRLVTDNLSTNTKMFTLLNNKVLCDVVPHPVDEMARAYPPIPCIYRPLYLSFDPCHILKNVRNLGCDRILEIDGKLVSFAPLVKIYEIQKKSREEGALALPVRKLTKKHVMPNNLERQKVNIAIDIFRPDVIATLQMFAAKKVQGSKTLKVLSLFYKHFKSGSPYMTFQARLSLYENVFLTRCPIIPPTMSGLHG